MALMRQLRGYSYIRLFVLDNFWTTLNSARLTGAEFLVQMKHIYDLVCGFGFYLVEGMSVNR